MVAMTPGGEAASRRAGSVLVTRPCEAGLALTRALNERGLPAVHLPLIQFAPPADPGPLTHALDGTRGYDWIVFTSPRAVEAVGSLAPGSYWKSVDCAAVGPGTARALSDRGVQPAAIAAEPLSLAVLPALGDTRGRRVLLPVSQRASRALADALRECGAEVDLVEAYRTLPRVPLEHELDALSDGVDAVVVASPTAVEVYARHVAPVLAGRATGSLAHAPPPELVAIGVVTAQAARDAGLGRVHVATGTETSDLVSTVFSTLARQTDAPA